MKTTTFFLIALMIFGCNSKEIGNSREELLNYEKDGYSIFLNEKPIKVSNVIFNQKEIEKIVLNENLKQIRLTRKDTTLHLMSLSSIAGNLNPEDEIIVIDGSVFKYKDFEKTSLEMSSVKSVRVVTDSTSKTEHFHKVHIFETYSNDH